MAPAFRHSRHGIAPPNAPTDARRAREFAAAARSCRPQLYAISLQLTGSAADAEDVVQETLLRAFQHLERFEGKSALRTWLYRIALNRALSCRQRRDRERCLPLDDDRLRAALAVDAHNPQEAALLSERYRLLLDALDRLSPVLRATVVLVTLQGLSYGDAARVLGCRPGTVAFRLHQARKQLRRRLDPRSGVRRMQP